MFRRQVAGVPVALRDEPTEIQLETTEDLWMQ